MSNNGKYYGVQTKLALENFKVGTELMPHILIKAIILIKKIAAEVNAELKLLDIKIAESIIQACDEVLRDFQKYQDNFPLKIWQSGSGTQTNMNVNEVIANLSGGTIHPNDHVNRGQSTNDVFPTAMHITTVLEIKDKLLPALRNLEKVLQKKEKEFKDIIKIGRTHLQDATPITLGQEFSGYKTQIKNAINRINKALTELYQLAIGGTAVGTGLNSHPDFAKKFAKKIREYAKIPFVTGQNKFELQATNDRLVNLSGVLNTLSVSLYKIANDIRFLASGPRSGIGELILPAREPGSSIMPGKVNPTQIEVLIMICQQVMGNHLTITLAGAGGQLELNANRPVLIYNLFQSINLLTDGINSFNKNCLIGVKANKKRLAENLNNSLMLATVLTPKIGYDKTAQIARLAYEEGLTLKEAAIKLGFLTEEEFDKIVDPKKMI